MTADRLAFPLFLALVALGTFFLVVAPALASADLVCSTGSYGAVVAGCPGR
jgi:hypothetical protein